MELVIGLSKYFLCYGLPRTVPMQHAQKSLYFSLLWFFWILLTSSIYFVGYCSQFGPGKVPLWPWCVYSSVRWLHWWWHETMCFSWQWSGCFCFLASAKSLRVFNHAAKNWCDVRTSNATFCSYPPSILQYLVCSYSRQHLCSAWFPVISSIMLPLYWYRSSLCLMS